ncbi:MAG: MiaB/RimO family radical SAM methylthiotransferase [Deltaproteobacteria bacterium]|jgi:tRNA-2-methylthio-N6-dimethylallyladenosine synthase|nr:MiaB/RimO family radical SAM methylthiotransferase [Deltaproteobacteria bacterium]
MPGQRLFHIITFGCQMNVYDSGRLQSLLEERGWAAAPTPDAADFIFLNTCSIREKAARRVLSRLRDLAPLKKKNPRLLVGVGGCVAEQEGANLIKLSPIVDLAIGPRRLAEIPALLDLGPASYPIILAGDSPGLPGDSQDADLSGAPEAKLAAPAPFAAASAASRKPAPLSAFLTIMEGCDNFCAYCVVPYVRGRETSRPRADILLEAQSLIQRGAREITLLGQNVNSYAPKLNPPAAPGEAFASLLREASALPGLWRLRFTTSHPKDFPPRLSSLFATLPNLAPSLHLPLQAGSDRVLKAMGRHYAISDYFKILSALREARPDIAITTDIMTGFPGETEEDFQETLAALREARFDSIFSFKYSDRPGVRASSLPDKVPEEEKGRRLSLIIATQREIGQSINRALVGAAQEVLAEGPARLPGQLTGRAGNNKIVNFMGPASLIGSLVPVTIVGAGPNSLTGVLKSQEEPTPDAFPPAARASHG